MLLSRADIRKIRSNTRSQSNLAILDLESRPIEDQKKVEEENRKRMFLRLAGLVGLGVATSTLIPKKASALVFGSTPASNVVGVKDSTNARINPATEETVASLLKASDLTFDGTDLQVKVTSMPAGGSSSFSDSGDNPVNALVDDVTRRVQVDVLSSALPTAASRDVTLETISLGGLKLNLIMVTSGDYDYIGEAAVGTATSATGWRIKRIENTASGLIITWAEGSTAFEHAWDNGAPNKYSSYTYS